MTQPHTDPPTEADPAPDDRAVALLLYAIVFLDIAWCLLMVALVLTGGRSWPVPVAVVAFIVAQGLVALTWRTRPRKRRTR